MTILQIVYYLLKVTDTILSWAYQQKFYDQGMDEAIARVAASILSQSKFAKKVMDEVNSMSPDAVDDLLRKLEPQSGDAGSAGVLPDLPKGDPGKG